MLHLWFWKKRSIFLAVTRTFQYTSVSPSGWRSRPLHWMEKKDKKDRRWFIMTKVGSSHTHYNEGYITLIIMRHYNGIIMTHNLWVTYSSWMIFNSHSISFRPTWYLFSLENAVEWKNMKSSCVITWTEQAVSHHTIWSDFVSPTVSHQMVILWSAETPLACWMNVS